MILRKYVPPFFLLRIGSLGDEFTINYAGESNIEKLTNVLYCCKKLRLTKLKYFINPEG